MSRETHREFLEREARRVAARERERRHKERWSAQELGKLRIQTVEPWKRVLIGLFGLVVAGSGAWALFAGIGWLAFILLALGVLLICIGLVGRKKTLEAVLNGIDVVDLLFGAIESIDP